MNFSCSVSHVEMNNDRSSDHRKKNFHLPGVDVFVAIAVAVDKVSEMNILGICFILLNLSNYVWLVVAREHPLSFYTKCRP